MTQDRERLIDKIRKLRAKGSDSGVTEDEANAFLDAAARLMAENNVGADDLAKAGIGVEPVEKVGAHTSIHKMHPACTVLDAIGKLTGTSIGVRVETIPKPHGGWREIGALTISGRQQDREVADYMFDQVRNLIDAAWRTERERRLEPMRKALGPAEQHFATHPDIQKFAREKGYGIGHKERRSFGFGMARRLAQRIEQMATRHADSSNALAVWHDTHEVTPDKKPPKPLDIDHRAFSKGSSAGSDVALGDGLASGQRHVHQIEKRTP
jgi:hypothetical protein